MGCWNATCGLTQLPITPCVKVKLFILQPTYCKNLTTTSYSDDYFRPILPPLTGYYDDYGGIENVEHDSAYHLTINWLQSQPGRSGESIWDYLIDLERCRTEETMMLVIDEIYTKVTSRLKRNEVESHILELQKSYNDWAGKEHDSLRNSVVSEYMIARLNLKGYTKSFNDQVVEILGATKIKDLDYWIDFLLFRQYMSRVRKLWIPQTGAGSQSADWNAHRLLTTVTRNHINNQKKNKLL